MTRVWHLCYALAVMPAKNPRVNVVLERPLYEAFSRVAKRDGASLSLKAKDLLRDALETYEDLALGWLKMSKPCSEPMSPPQ